MEDVVKLYEEIRTCRKCKLCEKRINAVVGEGNLKAQIVFIGEGPGKNEDEMGRPFVGQAGKFLDEMLASIGFKREDVYITNIVKCRPPENRDPEEVEKNTCSPYLEIQLEIINPKIIITLGRHSMNYFLPTCQISKDHGQPKRRLGRVFLPLYHPAAALYNGSLRQTLLKDFQLIPKLLKRIDLELESNEDVNGTKLHRN